MPADLTASWSVAVIFVFIDFVGSCVYGIKRVNYLSFDVRGKCLMDLLILFYLVDGG
jgi:hypothetical protein